MPKVSDNVERTLREENISPAELEAMVERSAITSLRGYNRRFNQWLFKVGVGGTPVYGMATADMLTVGSGRSKQRMFEDHEECRGRGCKACGWNGQVVRVL